MTNKAYTFMELMVVTLIFVFIAGGIYGVMDAGKAVYDADMTRMDLQAFARRALDTMTAELRQTSLSNITLSDGDSQIQFEIPVDISSGDSEYSGPISYYLNDENELIREYPAGTQDVLARYVSDLVFCCWDGTQCVEDCSLADSVTLQLWLEKNADERPIQLYVTEKVSVRNDF